MTKEKGEKMTTENKNIQMTVFSEPKGNIYGYGSFISGLVEIRFKLVMGRDGLFASLPTSRGKTPDPTGRYPYFPEVKFLDEAEYINFQSEILAEYNKQIGNE